MARKAEVARKPQVRKAPSKTAAKTSPKKAPARKVMTRRAPLKPERPSKPERPTRRVELSDHVDVERTRVIEECTEILNRLRVECLDALRTELRPHGEALTGDEGDMSKLLEQCSTERLFRDKTEERLRDVQLALRRVEEGTYGICEETGEEIELKRLKAIPWTRWSREGAEIRERIARQFSRHYYGGEEGGMFEDMPVEDEAQG